MEDEVLSFDNILGEEDIETLFESPEDVAPKEKGEKEDDAETLLEDEKEEKETTTEVDNPDQLFGEEDSQPESVGSEKKEVREKEDAVPDEDDGASPDNFYSSIANALAVDGILLNTDDEAISKVTSAESFSDLIEAEIMSRLDERQQRISKALDNGVEPNEIKRYENTLNFIASITDAAIAEESEKGEQLRRNLIYQDFLNKGYTPEKAQKFTERTIDAGTDVEDAKEALQSNKEYFQGAYNRLLQDAQKNADMAKAERIKQSEKLKNSLLKDKNLMGDMELSADVRKKAFDSIAKPVYKDPDTGEYLTAIQKYEMENRGDFLKYVGLMFAVTNGFKDFSSFVKGAVKKEVRKGIRDLERTLNNTSRTPNGNLRMVSSAKDDPESWLNGDIKLAL